MTTYPPADTRSQWFADNYPGSRINPNCGVLHTTESISWPGYEGGATAPNYTVYPDIKHRRLRFRAHFPDEMSSRALRNLSGGVETNTANAVQVELIGTCDWTKRERWGSYKVGVDYLYWPHAPEWALDQLAEFIAWMNTMHKVRISGVEHWLNYGPDDRRPGISPASYGAHPFRMTFGQWRQFYGWCGHQHVPENTHGDPGRFPWPLLEAKAKVLINPVRPPSRGKLVDHAIDDLRRAKNKAQSQPKRLERIVRSLKSLLKIKRR